jgi:hypothetical protein
MLKYLVLHDFFGVEILLELHIIKKNFMLKYLNIKIFLIICSPNKISAPKKSCKIGYFNILS